MLSRTGAAPSTPVSRARWPPVPVGSQRFIPKIFSSIWPNGARPSTQASGPFAPNGDEFLAFVGDAPLLAHDAGFEIAFISAELQRAAKLPIAIDRVVDALVPAAQAMQRI
jgi:hypothetical protein